MQLGLIAGQVSNHVGLSMVASMNHDASCQLRAVLRNCGVVVVVVVFVLVVDDSLINTVDYLALLLMIRCCC